EYPTVSDETFARKVVLVTGGSSGIGAATATLFGSFGARVAVAYFSNRTGADDVVEQIARARGRAAPVHADLRDAGQVHALVEDVEARFGPIDVLVNNAGALVGRYAIDAITETIWDDV